MKKVGKFDSNDAETAYARIPEKKKERKEILRTELFIQSLINI